MRAAAVATLAAGTLAVALAGSSTGQGHASADRPAACFVRPDWVTPPTAEQALRAGISAAIAADPVVHVQGHRYRRTKERMARDLLGVVRAGSGLWPHGGNLGREALRRCGGETSATRAAWAVIFGESLSVLCCETWTIFVVRTQRGWVSF